jgi:methionine sulfoxide reductase catalytic subunit
MPLDYPLWLRAAHFFNFLLLSLLVRSGLEILSAHPRFYWNDHCTPGSEWLKFTKKQRPEDRLWTASDEESSFPSAIALPGHENLGLGRHWHFLADFAWLLTGLTYVVMLFVTPEWRRLIPTSWQIVPDDRCSENPWSGSFSTRDFTTARSEYGFIARPSHGDYGCYSGSVGSEDRSGKSY